MHRTLELMPLCRCSPFFLSLSLTPLYNDDDKQQQQQKENQANVTYIYIYIWTRQKWFQDDVDDDRVIAAYVLVKYTYDAIYTIEKKKDVMLCYRKS
jgi:hypothetical protein